ncbi:translation initiation factor IF-2-like [Schistocerca gregaria]|uniref:translation initiation factor IF-2-like n=1 Tax=Schistocerca gregaria TaxID=7010 RepID=UPI00211F2BCB|nr:translation initiation factor IF-2-like [Schistocerca gregaria]
MRSKWMQRRHQRARRQPAAGSRPLECLLIRRRRPPVFSARSLAANSLATTPLRLLPAPPLSAPAVPAPCEKRAAGAAGPLGAASRVGDQSPAPAPTASTDGPPPPPLAAAPGARPPAAPGLRVISMAPQLLRSAV